MHACVCMRVSRKTKLQPVMWCLSSAEFDPVCVVGASELFGEISLACVCLLLDVAGNKNSVCESF